MCRRFMETTGMPLVLYSPRFHEPGPLMLVACLSQDRVHVTMSARFWPRPVHNATGTLEVVKV